MDTPVDESNKQYILLISFSDTIMIKLWCSIVNFSAQEVGNTWNVYIVYVLWSGRNCISHFWHKTKGVAYPFAVFFITFYFNQLFNNTLALVSAKHKSAASDGVSKRFASLGLEITGFQDLFDWWRLNSAPCSISIFGLWLLAGC